MNIHEWKKELIFDGLICFITLYLYSLKFTWVWKVYYYRFIERLERNWMLLWLLIYILLILIFVCYRSLKELQIKRMTRKFKVSVCGKALICGGYLILDDNHEGISLGLSSRCSSLVEMDETDEQSTMIDIYSDLLNTTWNYVLFKKDSEFFYEHNKYMIVDDCIVNSSKDQDQNPYISSCIDVFCHYLNQIHFSSSSSFHISISIYMDDAFNLIDTITNVFSWELILCVIVEDQNRTWLIFYIMFFSYCFALNFLFTDQVFTVMNTIIHSSPSTKDYLPFLLSFKSHCQAQQSVLSSLFYWWI